MKITMMKVTTMSIVVEYETPAGYRRFVNTETHLLHMFRRMYKVISVAHIAENGVIERHRLEEVNVGGRNLTAVGGDVWVDTTTKQVVNV